MKSKSVRDMIVFCMIGILVLGSMFFWAVRVEGKLPAYSVLNKSTKGFSVYLETLQTLGLEARQINEPLKGQPTGSVQIVAYNWWFDTEEPDVQKWVQDGGTLVLAGPDIDTAFDAGELISEIDGLGIHKLGKGRIITVTAAALTNKALTKDTATSWALTKELVSTGNTVVFNEFVLYPDKGNSSLWIVTPLWVKLAVYQLLILAAAWFWMKGNRLGKPIPFTLETERTELEYLNAAAHFYQAAGCWQMVFESYYRSFIRLLGAKEDDWLEHWRRESFPELHKAEALHRWVAAIPPGCTHKEIQQQIMLIEHLKDVIRNRRHNPWSSLKQQ